MPSSDTPHRREIECRGEAPKDGLSQDDERRDAREEDDHSGRSNAHVSTPTPRLAHERSVEVEQVADEASTTPAPAPVTFLVDPVALIVAPATLIVAPAAGVVVLALGVDEPLELATIEEDATTFGAAIDGHPVPFIGPHGRLVLWAEEGGVWRHL